MNDVRGHLARVEHRLQELGDRSAILERLYELQAAIDGRDWDTVRDTFTPDGSAYGRTGITDILAGLRDHLGGCGPTQHLLGNPRIF